MVSKHHTQTRLEKIHVTVDMSSVTGGLCRNFRTASNTMLSDVWQQLNAQPLDVKCEGAVHRDRQALVGGDE